MITIDLSKEKHTIPQKAEIKEQVDELCAAVQYKDAYCFIEPKIRLESELPQTHLITMMRELPPDDKGIRDRRYSNIALTTDSLFALVIAIQKYLVFHEIVAPEIDEEQNRLKPAERPAEASVTEGSDAEREI